MLLRRMIQATLEKLNTKKANKIQQNFPKPYWYTKQGGFDKYWYTNWGFIDRVGDLDKICVSSSSGCDETDVISRSSRTFKFEWTGGGNGMIESVLLELTALDVTLFEIEVEILMIIVNFNDMTICMA